MFKYFDLSYWFGAPIAYIRPSTLTLLIVVSFIFLGLYFGSIIISRTKKEKKFLVKLWQKIGHLGIGLFLIGLVVAFLRYENIPILGYRFIYPLWFLVGVVWGLYILKYAMRQLPHEKRAHEERQKFQKYLPS